MACRTGCRTQDHPSYGACLRDAGVRVTFMATPNNAWDKELALYANARRQGIQPGSTQTHKIQAALDLSDRTGVAFNAEKAT